MCWENIIVLGVEDTIVTKTDKNLYLYGGYVLSFLLSCP